MHIVFEMGFQLLSIRSNPTELLMGVWIKIRRLELQFLSAIDEKNKISSQFSLGDDDEEGETNFFHPFYREILTRTHSIYKREP